jgi:hypothetical protein
MAEPTKNTAYPTRQEHHRPKPPRIPPQHHQHHPHSTNPPPESPQTPLRANLSRTQPPQATHIAKAPKNTAKRLTAPHRKNRPLRARENHPKRASNQAAEKIMSAHAIHIYIHSAGVGGCARVLFPRVVRSHRTGQRLESVDSGIHGNAARYHSTRRHGRTGPDLHRPRPGCFSCGRVGGDCPCDPLPDPCLGVDCNGIGLTCRYVGSTVRGVLAWPPTS